MWRSLGHMWPGAYSAATVMTLLPPSTTCNKPPSSSRPRAFPPNWNGRAMRWQAHRNIRSEAMTLLQTRKQAVFAPVQQFYQPYSPEEDKQRTNSHYEQPVEFFYAVTGGKWNVYSCNLWGEVMTDTESQEAKLNLLAQLMQLKPGQRILDVGCGWGGPLVYLSKTYGVQGVGLTLSSLQKRAASSGSRRRASMWRSSKAIGAI